MEFYVVDYNGKVSSEGYCTFEEASAFCEGQSALPTNNPWVYQLGDDIYTITVVRVKEVTE